jgi:hypothetical protein
MSCWWLALSARLGAAIIQSLTDFQLVGAEETSGADWGVVLGRRPNLRAMLLGNYGFGVINGRLLPS